MASLRSGWAEKTNYIGTIPGSPLITVPVIIRLQPGRPPRIAWYNEHENTFLTETYLQLTRKLHVWACFTMAIPVKNYTIFNFEAEGFTYVIFHSGLTSDDTRIYRAIVVKYEAHPFVTGT